MMTKVLKVAQLIDQDGVPEVNIRRCRIEPRLDAQWTASLQAFDQFGFNQELVAPPLDDLQTVFHIHHLAPPRLACDTRKA